VPTILVADDNSNIQKMVALAFKEEGINVIAVGNGEAAVRKAAEIVPDLVLADIFMPVRNGYEVCEYIKQDPKLSHIPVVLLVGAFDPFNEREAQRVSADGVLKKPFVPPDPLVGIVKSLLAKTASAQLVPVAVSAEMPAVAAISQPAPFAPTVFTPPPVRVEVADPIENEIEEEQPVVADFSLQPAQVESGHAGGADAFSSMLDTVPLGTVRPFLGAPAEKNHSAEPQTHSSGIFAAGAGVIAPIEDAASRNEEKFSPDDSAQFPPLREQIVRDWGVHSPSPARADEELGSEIGSAPAKEDWRASFPVSDNREAGILQPSEPAIPAWRDFRFSTGRIADRFAAGEPEIESAPDAERNSAQVAEPVAESRQELSSPVEIDSPSEEPSPASVEEIASVEAIAPEADLAASSTVAGEIVEPVPDLQEAAANAWNEFNAQAHESQTSEHLSEAPVASTEDAAADYAAHDSITFPAADPGPAPLAPPSLEAASIVDFPAISAVVESATEEAQPAHAESGQEASTPAEAAPAESAHGTEGAAAAESFSVPGVDPADPRVVEEIVARVVERMQPQILEIVTREVLRPVVEALVRKQLDQK
jgi:CheY-like chemotaxis protein